jgi:hypothetical protein
MVSGPKTAIRAADAKSTQPTWPAEAVPVSRAMIKLGARDRAQLVVFAYQTFHNIGRRN